ncbi:D-sedoheptulose 7-phosphate isomerase [Methylophilaceae bacterium]|nr:D-sedoheptulose 7-phosphate isomerase [Methylophilaceae bacterium]
MQDVIKKNCLEHLDVINKILESHIDTIDMFADMLTTCLENDGTIFWCGNGGSASDSQHLAAELVGRFKKDRRALRSLALTTDTSILTSVGNDYGFEEIFSRQFEALGGPQDILVGISTSGNSKNIIRAFNTAKSLGALTLAITGNDGGELSQISDESLVIKSESTARIQEAHILIGHIFCDIIEQRLKLV